MKTSVLHLRSGFTVGGPEKLLLALVANAAPDEFRMTVSSFVLPDKPNRFLEAAASGGIATAPLAVQGSFDRSAIGGFRKICSDVGAELVVAHDYRALAVALLARRNSSVKRPIISVAHGWTGQSWRVRVYERLERWMMPSADRVVAVSQPKQAELLRLGLPNDKVVLIENAVDIPDVDPACVSRFWRDRFSWPDDVVVVGTVGRLSPEKAQHHLIAAAAQLRDDYPMLRWVLIGDGPQKPDLEAAIRDRGLDKNVVFGGWIDDMSAAYMGLDIFTLSSDTEGLPMALLEAMAHGRPAVTTNVGGCGNVIEPNRSGLLVEPGDHEQLAQAIARLAGDASLRREMALRAQERIRTAYSLASCGQAYVHLYRSLIGATV